MYFSLKWRRNTPIKDFFWIFIILEDQKGQKYLMLSRKLKKLSLNTNRPLGKHSMLKGLL